MFPHDLNQLIGMLGLLNEIDQYAREVSSVEKSKKNMCRYTPVLNKQKIISNKALF